MAPGEAARLSFRVGEAWGELTDTVLGAPGGCTPPLHLTRPQLYGHGLGAGGSADATHFLPSWACRCTSWSPSTAW